MRFLILFQFPRFSLTVIEMQLIIVVVVALACVHSAMGFVTRTARFSSFSLSAKVKAEVGDTLHEVF